MYYSTDNYDFGGTPETSTVDYYEDELKDDIEGTVYILRQCWNVSTNPITITRIFPYWPMEQI